LAYQKPKKDHPWRRYKTWYGEKPKRKLSSQEKETIKELRSVKLFLNDLVGNWERIEVYTHAYGRTGRYYLKELPPFKAAAWVAGVLKNNYGGQD